MLRTVDRHLRRVAADAVVLHLWQAVQLVIDLAVSSCVGLGLSSPPTYADAFRMLAGARVIPDELAQRLGRAAGFRNLVVHADAELDLLRVHTAATSGPASVHRKDSALSRRRRRSPYPVARAPPRAPSQSRERSTAVTHVTCHLVPTGQH